MRESAELLDDLEVQTSIIHDALSKCSPFRRRLFHHLLEQSKSLALGSPVLDMLERHQVESLLDRVEPAQVTCGDPSLRDGECLLILVERSRRASVYVARELIENKDERQAGARLQLPVPYHTLHGTL